MGLIFKHELGKLPVGSALSLLTNNKVVSSVVISIIIFIFFFWIYILLNDFLYFLINDSMREMAGSFISIGDSVYLSTTLIGTSVNRSKDKLNPFYITGFSDAESTFGVYILKDARYSVGLCITHIFQIRLHLLNIGLLEGIKAFFFFV